MKRIALIRNSYSFDVGGAEIFPINLAKILEATNYDPIILAANKKTLALAESAKLKTIRSPWWSFQDYSGKNIVLFPVFIIWQLYLITWYLIVCIKYNLDIVHPQSRDDFIAATISAKLLSKKVIWSDHADLKHIYSNHKFWYKNPVGKLVYFASLLADNVTIESLSEKKLIEKTLSKSLPSNYSVIHIGVVDCYKPNEQRNNKLVFVATSRLVKAKGIGELIAAFNLIGSETAVLKLCGDGPDRDYFKSLVEGNKNIEFLGHVQDVSQILQAADIFVHPTYHEGFGLSLIEAEMCSLPIIASKVGSVPEIVKDGVSGILIQSRNIKELAEAMTVLINNEQLRLKMGKAGRQIYLENFQLDKIVKEKFLPLYE